MKTDEIFKLAIKDVALDHLKKASKIINVIEPLLQEEEIADSVIAFSILLAGYIECADDDDKETAQQAIFQNIKNFRRIYKEIMKEEENKDG